MSRGFVSNRIPAKWIPRSRAASVGHATHGWTTQEPRQADRINPVLLRSSVPDRGFAGRREQCPVAAPFHAATSMPGTGAPERARDPRFRRAPAHGLVGDHAAECCGKPTGPKHDQRIVGERGLGVEREPRRSGDDARAGHAERIHDLPGVLAFRNVLTVECADENHSPREESLAATHALPGRYLNGLENFGSVFSCGSSSVRRNATNAA